MRKIFVIILFNIIIFFSLFILTDYHYAKNVFQDFWNSTEKNNKVSSQTPSPPKFNYSIKIVPFDKIWYWGFISPYRINMEKTSNKPSILVFGCSFAQGTIPENFEYFLSYKTKRMVYNRGYTGLGIANMYAQVSNPNFYKLLYQKNQPEYAIFIFISDHIYRLYSDKYGLKEQIYVKDDISPLGEGIKTNILRQISRFYSGRRLLENYFFSHQLAKENNDKNFDLMKLYFEKSKEELEKRFPKIKFIIIKYPSKQIGNPAHLEIYKIGRASCRERV